MASNWADASPEHGVSEGQEDEKIMAQPPHTNGASSKRRRKKKKNKENDDGDSSDGGWETFGRKKEKNQMKEKYSKPTKPNRTTKQEDVKADVEFKSQRWLFVAPIHELDEETVKRHFENYGEIVNVVTPSPRKDQPKPSHCFILFKDAKVVEKLVEKHYDFIIMDNQKKRVEMKRFDPDPKKYWDKKKLDEEKLLAEMENQPKNLSRNIKISEKRTGIPKYLTPGQDYSWNIIIENTSTQDRTLLRVYAINKRPEFSIFDKIQRKGKGEGNIVLGSGDKHEITIKFNGKQHGILSQKIVLEFTSFQLTHEVTVMIGSEEEMKLLDADTEPEYEQQQIDEVKRSVIPAFPQGKVSKIPIQTPSQIEASWTEKIAEYAVPDNIQLGVDKNDPHLDFNPWMVRENYKTRLHNLLFIEEAQQNAMIRNYDMRDVLIEKVTTYDRNGKNLPLPEPCSKLVVPGLAEKRPRVNPGDTIYAWVPSTQDVEFEGYVFHAEKDTIIAIFNPDFHSKFTSGTRFNLRFTFNRLNMRLMHRAIDVANVDLVWPAENAKPKENGRARSKKDPNALTAQNVKWVDAAVKFNDYQANCIVHILNNTNGIVPFLIFGPFGTGKTRTLTELTRQILSKDKVAKILICAPSNNAADAIALNLKDQLDEKTLFRLYASNRNKGQIPPALFKYTRYDEKKDIFTRPNLETLKSFRVIITTPITSADLYGAGLGNKHFTHIILDEAAQMMEPEALIPISLANESTSIIMAGDDKQLGPSVQSASARRHGLSTSIMERIVSLPVYKKRKDSSVSMELSRNYTWHPKILEFMANFYDIKLHSLADHAKVNSLLQWSKLPNKKFPILFFGVQGEDKEIEANTIFNPLEASAVAGLVDNLIKEQKLSTEDVGVISPYHKQVEKIRLVLSQKELGAIKVGTTEQLRGHILKAVFISPVSSRNYTSESNSRILNDVKAMITSIQTATSLLVVVGDPTTLSADPNWKQLIDYCQKNQSYLGYENEEEEEGEEEGEKQEGNHTQANHTQSNGAAHASQEAEAPPAEATEDKKEIELVEVKIEEIPSMVVPPTTQLIPVAVPGPIPIEIPNQQWAQAPPTAIPSGMPVHQQLQAVLQGNQLPIPPPEMMYPILSMTQNPVFIGGPYQAIPPSNIPDSYVWIHHIHGQQFIGFNKDSGYAPLVVHDKGDCLEVEISIFNLGHSIHYQGNWIYIQLFQNLNFNFMVPTLFQTGTKEHFGELVVAVPLEYFDMRLIDIAVSRTILLITIPRRHPLGPPNNTNQQQPMEPQQTTNP